MIIFVYYFLNSNSVHIRKTDKLKGDATEHSIDEYMKYADEYYERLEKTQTIRERKVFVATDDVMSIEEITKRYSLHIYSLKLIHRNTNSLILS